MKVDAPPPPPPLGLIMPILSRLAKPCWLFYEIKWLWTLIIIIQKTG